MCGAVIQCIFSAPYGGIDVALYVIVLCSIVICVEIFLSKFGRFYRALFGWGRYPQNVPPWMQASPQLHTTELYSLRVPCTVPVQRCMMTPCYRGEYFHISVIILIFSLRTYSLSIPIVIILLTVVKKCSKNNKLIKKRKSLSVRYHITTPPPLPRWRAVPSLSYRIKMGKRKKKKGLQEKFWLLEANLYRMSCFIFTAAQSFDLGFCDKLRCGGS